MNAPGSTSHDVSLEARVAKLETYGKIVIAVAAIVGISVAGVLGKLQSVSAEASKLRDDLRNANIELGKLKQELTSTAKDWLAPIAADAVSTALDTWGGRLDTLENGTKCFESAWIPMREGDQYQLTHGLGRVPTKAWIWASAGTEGEKIVLMDSVLADGGLSTSYGYGSWLIDVTDRGAKLSAGPKSPTSMYGHVDQSNYWDGGKVTSPPVAKRFLKVVMCP